MTEAAFTYHLIPTDPSQPGGADLLDQASGVASGKVQEGFEPVQMVALKTTEIAAGATTKGIPIVILWVR